ncbi:universal stress protein [Rhizobium mongolense]|uniref:universal stress protein n=1 Tax=Rhizobium mongolense TaxID=57676 RepID=UPI0034A21AA0
MYTRILLPTDGSELAAKGVDHGLALANALGIPASVVSVTVPLSGFAYLGILESTAVDTLNDTVSKELEVLEKHIREKATVAGVSIEFINETSLSPADALLEIAERSGCDLIVMSSHGRRGIKRMMLGSQTAEVLANSTIPVLVVK